MEHIKDYDGLIVLTNEQKEDIMKDFESNNNILLFPMLQEGLKNYKRMKKRKTNLSWWPDIMRKKGSIRS